MLRAAGEVHSDAQMIATYALFLQRLDVVALPRSERDRRRVLRRLRRPIALIHVAHDRGDLHFICRHIIRAEPQLRGIVARDVESVGPRGRRAEPPARTLAVRVRHVFPRLENTIQHVVVIWARGVARIAREIRHERAADPVPMLQRDADAARRRGRCEVRRRAARPHRDGVGESRAQRPAIVRRGDRVVCSIEAAERVAAIAVRVGEMIRVVVDEHLRHGHSGARRHAPADAESRGRADVDHHILRRGFAASVAHDTAHIVVARRAPLLALRGAVIQREVAVAEVPRIRQRVAIGVGGGGGERDRGVHGGRVIRRRHHRHGRRIRRAAVEVHHHIAVVIRRRAALCDGRDVDALR